MAPAKKNPNGQPEPGRTYTQLSIVCSAESSDTPWHGVIQDASSQATDRNLLRTLIDTLPDVVYVKDRQSRFLLNNVGHAKLFGVSSPADLVGKCDHDFYPNEIADLCLADERELMSTGRSLINHEEMGKDAAGQTLWFLTTKVPLLNTGGDVIGLVGLSRSISEEKRAQLALKKAAEQLEESNQLLKAARDGALDSSRAKSLFLANMSHEIRTPMNGVIGMTELLKTTRLSQEQEEFVRTIAACGDGLMTVINDILDFSKIEAGQLTIESIEFQPYEILGDVLKLYARSAELKGLELIGDISTTTERTCLGDPVRLQQILSNLVGNAIKFTDRGYVLVTASVEQSTHGQRLLISVKDTGIGIPAERLQPIFESFTQVDASTTRRFGGTGLGLTICRQLVHLMGGKIAIDSHVGVGSDFRVEVQLGQSDVELLPTSRDLTGLHVLVCDDLPVNRQILVAHLRRAGCVVEVAERGTAAIDRIADSSKAPLDLLVLDYMMPVLNGLDVAKAIASLPIDSKPIVLMLTSAGNSLHRGEMDALGIRACLDKPILRAALLEAISVAVGQTTARGGEPTAIEPRAETKRHWLKVLLVEDNEINERVALLMLESLGCSVAVVRDGVAAVHRSNEDFDVILMDCQMPFMDGYEATEAIRRRESGTNTHIPIVALTASALEHDRRRCLAAGMDDHLSKPVTRASLLDALERTTRPMAA